MRHSQNRRENTHLFYHSGYHDTIKPYDIDMDINTILINAIRTQASCIPCKCWNQISINSRTIWRQIPNEDHTIILEGCPDDTVSSSINFTPPSSGGHNWDTFSCTCNRMSVCKVHCGNLVDDKMATTKSTGGMTQPDLIDHINDHLGVDFHTLQVQVAARKKAQTISQGIVHPHFQPSKHLLPSGNTTGHPGDVHHLMSDDTWLPDRSTWQMWPTWFQTK